MTSAEKQEIINVIIEFLEENGSQVGGQKVRDLTLAEMTDENLSALIIPSSVPSTGEWVQTTLKTMMRPITNGITDLNTIKSQTTAAKDAAIQATTGAENVNAGVVGTVVTITNRDGVSTSVNIGFEIYRTYDSVAAMNADADNVPAGKFVIIATKDPTDPDNAKLYCKNSQGTFTFLSDLDQASAKAWADWVENMKPQIESATDAANTAADRVDAVIIIANSDHTRAESDHTTASSDHTTAQSDHNRANTDHSTATTDHTQAVSDSSRAATDHLTAGTDHTTAVGDTARAATDHNTAVSDHTQAASDTTRAGQDHSTAQSDHSTATTDHATAVSDHSTAISDHDNYTADRQTFAEDETARQQTFEDNEAQRQQDFEDAEADRMDAMMVTRCFVDTTTMCLMFVQPEKDSTQYKVRNGNLNIVITYEE